MPQPARSYRGPNSRPPSSAARESAARRGYGGTWRKLRRMVLAEGPLCVRCLERGRTEPASEVDHITPLNDGGTNEWHNLQPLCKPCHSAKTARDVHARTGIGGYKTQTDRFGDRPFARTHFCAGFAGGSTGVQTVLQSEPNNPSGSAGGR